jgi:hypothetical protein
VIARPADQQPNAQLNFCREQFAQVFIELTERIGIGAE